MKHYITYQDALKQFNIKDLWSDYTNFSAEEWLDGRILKGSVFHFYKQGVIYIQKEDLIEEFKSWSDKEVGQRSNTMGIRVKLFEPHIINDGYLSNCGLPIIEDLVLDYHLDLLELSNSLKQDGIYGILNGTCSIIECCGRYIHVKIDEDGDIYWISSYYQDIPINFIEASFFEENELIELMKLSIPQDIEYDESSLHNLRAKAKKIQIPLPFRFNLEQMTNFVRKTEETINKHN